MRITDASHVRALVEVVNTHDRMMQGMQADIAVLLDVLLRKDAEVDELRALAQELEQRLKQAEQQLAGQITYGVHNLARYSHFQAPVVTITDGTYDAINKR